MPHRVSGEPSSQPFTFPQTFKWLIKEIILDELQVTNEHWVSVSYP